MNVSSRSYLLNVQGRSIICDISRSEIVLKFDKQSQFPLTDEDSLYKSSGQRRFPEMCS